MSLAIKVKNLTKEFYIDKDNPTSLNLLIKIITLSFKSTKFMALDNISFEINKGDRVGLIGDNGSGKTTLLRILSGLYSKTSGVIEASGKIATLLNVDTGMEWKLSARENIYLFAMMLGIEKTKIEKNIKNIIKFAGIKEFINAPLGDFSRGMIERLAFTIFRYTDADILLIDEMLSSGDIHFKEESYNVLKEFIRRSRTMIITSHDMEVIRKFCNKTIILKEGKIVAYGPTKIVVNKYYKF